MNKSLPRACQFLAIDVRGKKSAMAINAPMANNGACRTRITANRSQMRGSSQTMRGRLPGLENSRGRIAAVNPMYNHASNTIIHALRSFISSGACSLIDCGNDCIW
jgi:hypothetical protein